ncbi:hypothetical protein XFF6166_130025 [Xanthomonas citri pv. fuscans]|nr:hypothetical protein XFF6166_130025 [Xanthomonas citri pv. fuscans]SON98636.1 hypothetical protein XFF6960_100024 [Xanthomonas citri pv. fuscans]SOO05678.1 hypothetical protein XFF7767_470037 [Xanthomonas citri pv. fuscans]SOO08557.1 hypothetical protein XFF6970_240025 [Xanthomonas citri pv. fuscans]SOO14678.1 hypothetical protein XFF7766_340039 [Xanthomonas citri pv. fuscans]
MPAGRCASCQVRSSAVVAMQRSKFKARGCRTCTVAKGPVHVWTPIFPGNPGLFACVPGQQVNPLILVNELNSDG